MIDVSKYDIGLSIASALGCCMTRAYVLTHTETNDVTLQLEGTHEVVSGRVCFTGQHWVHNENVAYFDGEHGGDYGWAMLPYGALVAVFVHPGAGGREYYVVGIEQLGNSYYPAMVPLVWPYMPREDFFIIGTGETNSLAEKDHLTFPFVDITDPTRNPYALINTFTDAEGTVKSKGTAYPDSSLDCDEKINTGKVVRASGANFVYHFPYEWSSALRFAVENFLPTPILQTSALPLFGRKVGYYLHAPSDIDPYVMSNIHYPGVSIDNIPFMYLAGILPHKLAVVGRVLPSGAAHFMFIHFVVGFSDFEIVSGDRYQYWLQVRTFRFVGQVSVNTMLANGGIGYDGFENNEEYLTSIPTEAVFMRSSFYPLVDTTTFIVSTIAYKDFGYYEIAWGAPDQSSRVVRVSKEVTIDPMLEYGASIGAETVTELSGEWLKLLSYTLTLPYYYQPYAYDYQGYVKEEFDPSRLITVFEGDSLSLKMSVSGYWEHQISETNTFYYFLDVYFHETWDVDQTVIYWFDGVEVCREVKQCESDSQGTNTYGTLGVDEVVNCSFTRTSNVTVKEIVWVHIIPELSTFVFWECDFFTDASYEDTSFADATYRLCLWVDGVKTAIYTTTQTISTAVGKGILDPKNYTATYYSFSSVNPVRFDSTYEQRTGDIAMRPYGCGVPRWQLHGLAFTTGTPLYQYILAQEQFPQSYIDSLIDTSWNIKWSEAGIDYNRSMIEFSNNKDYINGSEFWVPALHPPCAARTLVYSFNVPAYFFDYWDFAGSMDTETDRPYPRPVAGLKGVMSQNATSRWGGVLSDFMVSPLLDGVYVRIKPYGTNTWTEYFSGTPSKLVALKAGYNDEDVPFSFWTR
ncbi:MAG: hypothetical protein RBS34_00295 [Desulfofustis sp.]|jgi:hypothetical protein|nr:hypothetical protein [Desulfofustis sp.]